MDKTQKELIEICLEQIESNIETIRRVVKEDKNVVITTKEK